MNVTVNHAVTLKVWCESSTDGYFFSGSDVGFECAESSHNFDIDATMYGFNDFGFVCSESTTFGVGSVSAQNVRNVTIMTDEAWLNDPSGCYNKIDFPATPTTPIVNPPTSPPISLPIVVSSTSPTSYPSMGPITVTSAPSMKSVANPAAPVSFPVVSPVGNNGNSDKSIVGVAIGGAVGGVALAAVIGLLVFFAMRHQSNRTSKKPITVPTYSNHPYTESNTDDDFASSRAPTTSSGSVSGGSSNGATATLAQPLPLIHPTPMYPITEEPHSAVTTTREVVERSNKREVFVPPPDMPPPLRNSMTTQTLSSSSSSPQRSAYPTNHVVDVKDQCRSVAMVRSSSPTLISQDDSSNIPFAVALGVSTTSSAMASVVSSTSSNNSNKKPAKEPSGRILTDV